MYSAASEWRHQRPCWAVIHASERAHDHLEVHGEPPSGWVELRDQLLERHAAAARAGKDIDNVFEAPLALAEKITGCRTDSDAAQDLEYETLVPVPKKPWWKRW